MVLCNHPGATAGRYPCIHGAAARPPDQRGTGRELLESIEWGAEISEERTIHLFPGDPKRTCTPNGPVPPENHHMFRRVFPGIALHAMVGGSVAYAPLFSRISIESLEQFSVVENTQPFAGGPCCTSGGLPPDTTSSRSTDRVFEHPSENLSFLVRAPERIPPVTLLACTNPRAGVARPQKHGFRRRFAPCE